MAVGVKASTSLTALELVMTSILDGTCTKEYILEQVALETNGKSRAEKVNRTIRRMTVNNPLLPYIKEHPQEFMANLHSKSSRPLVFAALMCGAYPIIYDTVTLLGKIFHAQDEVSMQLVSSKLSEKYGSSTDFFIAYNSTIKMLVDAGLIKRPRVGYYAPCHITKASASAMDFYRKAFLINNPHCTDSDDILANSFFEFVKQQ